MHAGPSLDVVNRPWRERFGTSLGSEHRSQKQTTELSTVWCICQNSHSVLLPTLSPDGGGDR